MAKEEIPMERLKENCMKYMHTQKKGNVTNIRYVCLDQMDSQIYITVTGLHLQLATV